MKEPVLNAEVKTRIPRAQKHSLQSIAITRHLKLADILREAIREKIDRENLLPTPSNGSGNPLSANTETAGIRKQKTKP